MYGLPNVAILIALAFSAAGEGPGAPRRLRCEYAVNPLAIDVEAPRLSWEVTDSRRGACQFAYEVQAARHEDDLQAEVNLLWSTGKVDSDQSIHVPYGGAEPGAGKRVYWRVRTWDNAGVASPWSEVAFWQRGLKPDDRKAQWITLDERREGTQPVFGDWIWHPVLTDDEDTRYFRKIVELPEDAVVQSAQLWGAANNEFYCHVNGEYAGGCDEWKAVEAKEFGALLKPGKNIFAIRGVHDRLAAGFTFGARIELADGQAIEVRSDTEWRCHDDKPEGWQSAEFDDTAWVPAKFMGRYGETPYEAAGERLPSRSIALRKDFAARGDVVRANVFASGLGVYQLFLNGQRVGKDELAPGWTHFKKRVQYQAYDVTDLLREGDNAIGMLLGNGWWGGCMAGAWKDGNHRGIAQLEITYANGEKEIVVSDESWRGTESPIVSDSIYNGEVHDARLEMPGWNAPGFDASAWRGVAPAEQSTDVLTAHVGPPIQVTEEIKPVSVTELKPGVFIFDFGQNAAGRARLTVRGEAGTAVQIRHAEVLNPDATLHTEILRGAKCTDTYILKGGEEEVWEPAFTYRGFRYAEVTGYPGTPTKDALTFRVMHANTPRIGEFTCSEDIINRVQKNTVWGARSNFYSVPTDCPQRDERLGWTGDMQLFLPAAAMNFDIAGYMTKWMADIVDSRNEDGSIPDVIPALSAAPGAPGWSDVVVTLPWSMLRYYGDMHIVEESKEAMEGHLAFMRAMAKDGLFSRGRYGDWVALEDTPRDSLAGAYQYLSTTRLSEMSSTVGEETIASTLDKEAAQIADRYNTRYFDVAEKRYQTGSQTAQVIPLAFGIAQGDHRATAIAALTVNLHARNNHLATGFIGSAYLMPALSDSGLGDLAGVLANNRTFPSWGYMAESGATTIWERWNSDTEEATKSGMNSFNHFTFGSVSQWYFEYLLGIRPLAPGFKAIEIKPHVEAATWARGSYHAMYGPIRCEWNRENGFTMTVEIPANTSAVIVPPVKCDADNWEGVSELEDGRSAFKVGAGRYTFVARK
ncbi:MAG: family 78 glycoside hydrolase catalytic domain [Candidatus Hydrogenedentes bacterium]|nr:family 78 glycoside hydrolase catalytic domain [Candidatus Hydrogenedentota bacterium]